LAEIRFRLEFIPGAGVEEEGQETQSDQESVLFYAIQLEEYFAAHLFST